MNHAPDAIQVTFLHRLTSYVAALFLHVVGKSSFFRRYDHPASSGLMNNLGQSPMVYAFWHNQQVILAYTHRGEGSHVVVSQSKDGEYIAQVMNRMKLIPIRGSATRGGSLALRKSVSILRHGGAVGFTPDGPKGPVGTVHPGVIAAAKMSDAAIIPIGTALSQKAVFNSWDKFELPLPFGRVVLVHGKPFRLFKSDSEEEATRKVRAALDEVREEAASRLEALPSWGGFLLAEFLFRTYQIFWILFFPLIVLGAGFRFGLQRGLKGLGERLGLGAIPRKSKKRFWIHAASVGEWRAAAPLAEKFKQEEGWEVFVTATTPEARSLAEKAFPGRVSLLPLDAPVLMSQFVKKMRADAAAIVETELWPGLIRCARCQKIPLFIVNGRLSEKSARRWGNFPIVAGDLLGSFTKIFTRGGEDAGRFAQAAGSLGRVSATGNLKIDNLPSPKGEGKGRLFESISPVLLGGSTWPGEEEWLMDIRESQNRAVELILAPRRLERVDEVVEALKKRKIPFIRWSEGKRDPIPGNTVLILDVMGELPSLYSSADVVFVGGSVFKKGGQNPLEPASAGSAVVFGPSMENFRDEARGLKEKGGAVWASSKEEAEKSLLEFLSDPEKRKSSGERSRAFVDENRGASERTFRQILGLLSLD